MIFATEQILALFMLRARDAGYTRPYIMASPVNSFCSHHISPMAATTPYQRVHSMIEDYPQELLEAVCSHIFYAGVPSFIPSLDPLLSGAANPPTAAPNSFPASSWTDHSVRRTLASLCMVNKAWYDAAKPWLWRRLEVRLPRSWLCLVDELAGGADGEAEATETALAVGKSIQEAHNAALAARSIFVKETDQDTAEKLHSDIMAHLDGSVPPEVRTLFLPNNRGGFRTSDVVQSNADLVMSCSCSLPPPPEIRAPGGYETRARVRQDGEC